MKRIFSIERKHYSSLLAFAQNMLLAYFVYMLCRVIFVLENWSLYHDTLSENSLGSLLAGSLKFDTSAILYTNALYALMMLFPCHLKEKNGWMKVAWWVFVVVNSLAIIMNLCDSVYVQFTGRRTTATVFQEFSNEGNLFSIFGKELFRHWYLVLTGIGMIWGLKKLAKCSDSELMNEAKGWKCVKKDAIPYYTLHVLAFVLFIPLMLAGMRGGFTKAVRPITISNANQYVNHPNEAAVILNTPFSLIRTIGKKSFVNPNYFEKEELDAIYSPEHWPGKNDATLQMQYAETDSVAQTDTIVNHDFIKKNVVVLIVESFGREFIGAYNEQLDDGKYKGFTPFVDKLYQESLSFDYTFANGRKSIDGMPSVLSSIPMFLEPFFLTSASLNDVSSLAGELNKKGYESAFFHGAENGSMGFEAFANSVGFEKYYGRTEFNEDKRFRGDKDFDGTWAIWDEPFLQFYAQKMSEMKQPFVTAVFTASSHHPFAVPEEYKDIYPEEGNNELHKCIRYTDHALEEFFKTASQQPWFRNTIFVLTSDHTNQPDHEEYKTDLGLFGAPILFYDPSGELIKAGRRHCIAEQIDIMPSVLGLLNYDKPYVAFGQDLFHTKDKDMRAVHYNNGIYQLVKDDWMMQFDGEKVKAIYNYKTDWMQKNNLAGKMPEIEAQLVRLVKAIIQSYMERMNENRLTVVDD